VTTNAIIDEYRFDEMQNALVGLLADMMFAELSKAGIALKSLSLRCCFTHVRYLTVIFSLPRRMENLFRKFRLKRIGTKLFCLRRDRPCMSVR
jgi:hypothetical protein